MFTRDFLIQARSYLYVRQMRRLNIRALQYFLNAAKPEGPAQVRHPVYLLNPQYMRIGPNFAAGPGLRIEAWDRYRGETFSPLIEIGANVSFNYNCHLGAIDKIFIGSDGLIGSNVLITDHSHGDLRALRTGLPFKHQPLVSSGPVIIGTNVWIGENASILGGVTVGDNVVIGANSVVTRDIPSDTVAAGVPAGVIRTLEA
jgi:acetyltransferase-like isoleucine patch superfamily enzyme